MQSRWTVDGVVLALPAREGSVALLRLVVAACTTAFVAVLVAVGASVRPPPAPVCATAQLCRAHLPPEINPDPPDLEQYVRSRVAEVLDSVRTLDRLPSDIDVVDHLALDTPGRVEWAFLEAEHGAPRVMAEVPSGAGVTGTLRSALEVYRREAGQERIHFQDDTRFVAEIQAVRSAVDRQEARARLDALAARNRSVLDLGTASARELVAAAAVVARTEWTARRQLETARLSMVTASLMESRTRAEVAWLVAMVFGGTAVLFGLGTTALLARRVWGAWQPVCIDVSGKGIRLDGTWLDRSQIVWVGLRDGALRVVTHDADLQSRAVADDRALHAALRFWRRLSDQDGVPRPSEEARVRRLIG